MPEANISPPTDDQSAAPEVDADAVAAEESAPDADARAPEETVPDADAAEESGPGADADAEVPGTPEAPEASGDDEPDARTADGDGAVHEEALAAQEAAGEEAGEWAGETEEEDHLPPSRTGLSPRQARRVRVILSAVVMTLVGLSLIVRLSSAPSVLTVGVYGFALSLFGGALVLSRRGRTRVATAVLAVGFITVVLAEQLFATAQ
jgi:hypothetical protein